METAWSPVRAFERLVTCVFSYGERTSPVCQAVGSLHATLDAVHCRRPSLRGVGMGALLGSGDAAETSEPNETSKVGCHPPHELNYFHDRAMEITDLLVGRAFGAGAHGRPRG